jgi:hypothetical protein
MLHRRRHIAACGPDRLMIATTRYEVLDRHPDCTIARFMGE